MANKRLRNKEEQELYEQIKKMAEDDFFVFMSLVNPKRLYGDIHKEVAKWLQEDSDKHKLLLLPRGHMKSHIMAMYAAWRITINPATTILYLSATTTLAEQQLGAIKNVLTSPVYSLYWPDMIHPDEGKREKWTNVCICVDHPKRKEEGVRDMTIIAAGLNTNVVGLHADLILCDDVVVKDNAYTEESRRKVAAAMALMTSILNPGGEIKACGTRYHPNDQYALWKEQTIDIFDDDMEVIGKDYLWDIFEREVEVNGKFLWPLEVRDDGKTYGFDAKILAKIRAGYANDMTQFYAQYYNDPNRGGSSKITRECFNYYNQGLVRSYEGSWYVGDRKLNIAAAVDFAYSLSKKADYSAIVVAGMDRDKNVYVLDIDRFRTDNISEYYERIHAMWMKWGFRKIRAEVTAAQAIIVNDLKSKIAESNAFITVEAHKPTRHDGSKELRISSILDDRYMSGKVFHYKGGYITALEEELIQAHPKHDDLKDTLASCIEILKPPFDRGEKTSKQQVTYNSRFGGVNFR